MIVSKLAITLSLSLLFLYTEKAKRSTYKVSAMHTTAIVPYRVS